MKKIIILCLALFVLFLSGCNSVEATKDGEVTIVVNSLDEEVFRGVISFKKGDTLVSILEGHREISMKGTKSDLGYYVEELCGIKASDTDSTYFNIKVNDEDSPVGIQGIELNDQDVIVFTLISYA
jgi:hypothetical protein